MIKLLVPVNSMIQSSSVISCLKTITTPNNASVELFYSSRVEYPIGADITMYAQVVSITQEHNKEEIEHLKNLQSELKILGFEVNLSTSEGFFVEEFKKRAKELNPDFVLMFTGGANNLIEEIFGTNTYAVIEEIDSPIIVIPLGHEPVQFKKAVVGLTLEDEDYSVLEHYFEYAEKMNITSRFVKIDNDFQLNVFDNEEVLKTLHEMYPGKINFIAHKQAEFPAEGLINYAKDEQADLIVLLTTHRNFINKIFHKSVTRDLSLHSKTPLLVYHY